MKKRDEPNERQTDKASFFELKAHQTKNIRYFLQPYFLFRAYIVFKDGKKFHGYGNEHQVTYNQLLYKRVDYIKLDRTKGYTDLVRMIERKFAGKYTRAQIYMRQPGEEAFNTLCRDYNEQEELVECQDPVLPDELQVKNLFYYVNSGLVIVTETDPAGDNNQTN